LLEKNGFLFILGGEVINKFGLFYGNCKIVLQTSVLRSFFIEENRFSDEAVSKPTGF
jgi:hypothetical protein